MPNTAPRIYCLIFCSKWSSIFYQRKMGRKNKISSAGRLRREVSANHRGREQTPVQVSERLLDVAPVTGFLKLMERWLGVTWNPCVLLTFSPHVNNILLDVGVPVSVSLVTSHLCFSTQRLRWFSFEALTHLPPRRS